jgi:hypothetical protein
VLLVPATASGFACGGATSTTTTDPAAALQRAAGRLKAREDAFRRHLAHERHARREARRERVRAERQAARRAQVRARRRAQRAAARRAADVAAQAEAQTQSNCDPNYSGACLDPNASDYDCAGGSGDGPEYTGPVRVVGSDPYGLDSDGDGYACE